jgi:RNA 2',3'-cyclic 3'-phosphodiesterase
VSDERARLFVALELPEPARVELVEWRDRTARGIPGLRPVASESMHVTLCFLGWLSVGEVDAIASACNAAVAGAAAARLRVRQGIWLPSRRPRVLAVGLEDVGGALGAAQAALSQALAAGGWYKPEARPFLAHVTVARVGRGGRVRAAELEALPAGLEVAGSRVTLFRSRLSQAGARYEALSSVELGSP